MDITEVLLPSCQWNMVEGVRPKHYLTRNFHWRAITLCKLFSGTRLRVPLHGSFHEIHINFPRNSCIDITPGSKGRFVCDPVQERKKGGAHVIRPAGDAMVLTVQIRAEKGKTKQIA